MNLEKITHYNKLIRDRIPEVIEQIGKKPDYLVLTNPDEYKKELYAKLQEEVDEYLSDETAEELADLIEVIYACAALKGIAPNELEAIRKKKFDDRGGFSKRLFLVSVTENI